MASGRWRNLGIELLHHLPFTVFAVAVAMAILAIVPIGSAQPSPAPSQTTQAEHADHDGHADDPHDGDDGHAHATVGMFHVFHPLHILFSAVATTAMFWRYQRRLLLALAVGTVGSLAICGVSDIFMPYASGLVLGQPMQLHVCLIEHPMLILPFAAVGLGVGLALPRGSRRGTVFSHAAHVLISAMASLLYLVGFGMSDWTSEAGLIFVFMVLAVVIPCCVSDIVLPVLAAGKHGHAGGGH